MINNEPNTVLFTMSHSIEREEQFILLGPLMIGELNLYALRTNKEHVDENFHFNKNDQIALVRSGVCHSLLRSAGINMNITNITKDVQAIKMAAKKRVDYFCSYNYTVANLVVEAGYTKDQFQQVYHLKNDKTYLAFSKDVNMKTVRLWKQAMITMIEDGAMAKIINAWIPNSKVPGNIEIR